MKPINLPKPVLGGDNVFLALENRRTIREIGDKPLSLQVISNLLWAAAGVNRPQGPFGMAGRTAGSASNSQEIDIYVLTGKGAYIYDAFQHIMNPVIAEDIRPMAKNKGQIDISPGAPLHLVFVADVLRLVNTKGFQEPGLHDAEVQKSYYFVDTGLIAGNVYLYAASVGLAVWFHNCDKTALQSKLKLRSEQRVLFGQTIGYPLNP